MVVKIDLTNFLFMIGLFGYVCCFFAGMYVVGMLSISSRQGIFLGL
jgi:hypothetical protein